MTYIWKIGPMWQTKYAAHIPKNLGLGLNFRPCSEGYFLSGRPQSVLTTDFSEKNPRSATVLLYSIFIHCNGVTFFLEVHFDFHTELSFHYSLWYFRNSIKEEPNLKVSFCHFNISKLFCFLIGQNSNFDWFLSVDMISLKVFFSQHFFTIVWI